MARRRGAALVARNIARHLETGFADQAREWRPLVLCWRGGMRSAAMTQVLQSVGWRATQLPGGYKRWRAHVVAQLAALPQTLRYRVVCGPTGSGKSRLLQALATAGAQVLDLEALAAHRGSVLGALPGQPQPPQRLFESLLLRALLAFDAARPVFVEAESRRIGAVALPDALLATMRASACVRIEAGEAARVALLLADYRHFRGDLPALAGTLGRLHELHGRERIAGWMALAESGAFGELAAALLRCHYDPLYRRSSASNYSGLAGAATVDGGGLEAADFARMAAELVHVH
jgi:tRNA 2-selenouridine synthase